MMGGGLPPQKRPLFSHEKNNAKSNETEPTQKMKKLDVIEATVDSKQSTPLKRLPKKETAAAVHSDFSDWDESPIKHAQASHPHDEEKHRIAEKENSELDDSFDDPVILNSGVDGFPSLNDSKGEVLLTVRDVKNEEGLVDLMCVTDNGQQSVVYLQDHWAEVDVEPNTRIRLIGAKPWGDADWLVSNEHGVMIVAPDTLVPCTSIAGATWCPRKAALRCANPRTVSRDWLLHIWQENIRNEVIAQLVALRFTPSQFETELEPYLDVHDIEENIWLPQLGLKGKVDATLEVDFLFLATARRRELIIDLAPPSYPYPDVATLPVSVQKLLSDSVKASELSIEQRDAVQAAILSTEYTLIEGFPGSGKTTTIVTVLRCLLEMNCSVLLATNTHSALDNVLTKLRKYTSDSKILRLGNSASARDNVSDLTLESKLKCSEEDKYKAARNILKQTKCELLRDKRRINVALTRAKHKLIIVGCAESMRTMDIMGRVVDGVKVVKL
ncbi:DNA replication factor Dna2 [Teladorsagia circumcincta]|uniref:DNA replication ATP-dependent helicase/nuclease n=1 Tax=Teladorsagia circumcincta TaxID=45464 RepID=A0A2G9UH36_TELCI|nr:DNA replication factor Dna2 [Teladorsagia circumcincta]